MIFCKRCGKYSPKGTTVCPKCQADLSLAGHESFSGSAPPASSTSGKGAASGSAGRAAMSGPLEPAGIPRRFVAIVLDGLIMAVVSVAVVLAIAFGGGSLLGTVLQDPNQVSAASLIVLLPLVAALLLLPLFYECGLIVKRGATLGKSAMKLTVVRTNGDAVTWGRAILRWVIKTFISGILLIGFLMAFFTAKKQALHDLIADTMVVPK